MHDPRIFWLERALLQLLDRTDRLERELAGEISQRQALEEVMIAVSGVPKRVDRLELEAAACRRRHAGNRGGQA